MDIDVIVVGAGPAGSTAAREIAVRGHGVLLLDREDFPRDKPCGGGISLACAGSLPFDIGPVVERRVRGLILGDPRTGTRIRDWDEPYLYLVQRSRFDALLLGQARAAGVAFEGETRVQHLALLPDGRYEVTGHTAGGAEVSHRARVVVGADGANSVVRRFLGWGSPSPTAVALEGSLPCPDGVPEWLAERIAISPGLVPGGYGWLFPKGDHINIGVGGWKVAGALLQPALDAYVRANGWDPAALVDLEGHLLPLREPGAPSTAARVALVGDAAGLVDPLTGGGIENGVASAIALAPVVSRFLRDEASDLAAYEVTLRRTLYPRLRQSAAVAEVFYAAPRPLTALALRAQRFLDVAVPFAAGGSGGGLADVLAGLAVTVAAPLARLANRARYGAH